MPIITELARQVNLRTGELVKLISTQLSGNKKKGGTVPLATAAILVTLYLLYQKISKPPKHLRHLPTVSAYQFFKHAFTNDLFENWSKSAVMPVLKQNPCGLYLRQSTYGWTLYISNPVVLKQMLTKPEHVYPKKPTVLPKGTLPDRFICGPNILFHTGADWRKHKSIANAAFQRCTPVGTFGNLTLKMFRNIEKYGYNSVDILSLFEKLTLDAIGIAGFDFHFNALDDADNKWVRYYDTIKDGLMKPLFLFLPIFDTKYVGLFKERKQVHDMLTEFQINLNEIIEQRRQIVKEKKDSGISDGEKDLLTLMIESEEGGDKEGLTNEELQSNLCIFFIAGHDTTANTLSFILYELAANPEIQEKARQEAIQILGDKPEDIIPTLEQVKEFSYLTMVIKETLRRHPPVYNTTSRIIKEDTYLAGQFIPKGTEWGADLYNIQHNPAFWKDPYTFNPDRFLPGGEVDQQDGIAWLPFNYGQRQCTGMNFSLVEQRVVLSMLLRKYRWTLPKDSPYKRKLETRGVAFGMIILKEKLRISFEELY